MVLFLYSDKNCEHQAINCIKSLEHKITDDIKIVYYTIGFDSSFEFRNLYKFRIPLKPEYPTFHFYKADLALATMNLFPNDYYIFTDTDVLFSRRFSFEKLKHQETYPIASFGPHEYPFMWKSEGETTTIYDETKLMKYFNVTGRSQRYVWSCFFTFNSYCKDFFEEYISMCKNSYLMSNRMEYFPYADETPFNICLWKRGATKNLEFAFVNTHSLNTVKIVEAGVVQNDIRLGNSVDRFGADWEYIVNPEDVILYHGFKQKEEMEETLNYLVNE